MKKLINFISKWIREIVPVFIGVLLALYFSNVKEQKDKDIFTENLKQSMLVEIEGNIEDLDSLMSGEKSVMDTLELYMEQDSTTIYNVLLKTGVITFPSMEFSTWSIIQSSGNAFVMEAESLRELVSMDIMINKHHINSVNNLGEYILQNMYKNDPESKMTLYLMLGNNLILEQQIREDLQILAEMIREERR